MNRTPASKAGQIIGTMAGLQVIALDIAKSVFQIHSVDMQSGEIINKQLKVAKVIEQFTNRAPCLIAMEACGSAHHWARTLQALGHSVRLLDARKVRPFVTGNKTDASDARAIWLAAQQPDMQFVGLKSVANQAVLTLHRQRELLQKMRTMQSNALRGLLYEFGASFGKGRVQLLAAMEQALEGLQSQLPQMVIDSLREQVLRIQALGVDIAAIEKRIALLLQSQPHMARLMQIPGVGPLIASAAIATMGDAASFQSGRQFCAWLGLVPRQVGTGGKVKLLGISKRGDRYLRQLLVHGARSVVHQSKSPSPWVQELRLRRPDNVVVVAQAAKIARTIWALTAKEQDYRKEHVSARPQRPAQAAR
jgi:transposase